MVTPTDYLNAGRTQEALDLLAQTGAAELTPELEYTRAVALARTGQTQAAIATLTQLVRIAPHHTQAQALLTALQPQSTTPVSQPSASPMSPQPLTHPPIHGLTMLNPTTLARLATAPGNWRDLLSFHHLLATDEYVATLDEYYRSCQAAFGDQWYYLDIVNTLYAASKAIQPRHYLEIGVRRGRSVCTVVRGCPTVNVYAFDMWMADYAGMENPGPEYVRSQLQLHNHQGQITFIDGDSHQTLPQFFADNPDLKLDLITVDGDHSEEGALADLCDVIPHLAVGGVLVFDDISHPEHPYLLDVWRRAMAKFPELSAFEFAETGYGIGFAVRRAA